MARTVYSTSLAQELGLNGTFTYVVAAGFTVVVRDIDAYANAGVFVQHLRFEGTNGQTIWSVQADPDTSVNPQWRGRQVFEEGQHFTIVTDDTWDVTISGYVLVNA